MKISFIARFTMCTAVTALLLVGCATTGHRAYNRTASEFSTLADKIEAAGTQMDIAASELDGQANNPPPELQPQFERFAAAVNKLNSLSNLLGQTEKRLAARADLHRDSWEKSLVTIRNADIRKSGESRQAELQERFDAVRTQCPQVQTAVAPVQSDLQDVVKFLKVELTPNSVKSISTTANRITAQTTPVRQRLSNLVADLRQLSGVLAPREPAPPETLK